MYLAVGSVILGQALLLGRAALLVYLVLFALAVEAFVRLYEEPALAARYGDEYAAYCENVPRWWASIKK
jgi:protein-S-isoprenylcysteine O-methyltransferase Ste14